MKETLGSLKRKVTTKEKVQKKAISKYSSSTAKKLSCRLKYKPPNLDLLQIYEPRSIKLEDAEYDYTQPQARSLAVKGEHQSPCDPLELSVSNEKSIHALNQLSYKYPDYSEFQNQLASENPKIEEILKVDNLVVKYKQPSVFSDSDFKERESMTDAMACDEPTITVLREVDRSNLQISHPLHSCPLQSSPTITNSICGLNQVSCKHVDYAELQNPIIIDNLRDEDLKKVDTLAIKGEPLVSICSEVKRGKDMTALAKTVLVEGDSADLQICDPHYSCSLQPSLPDEFTSLDVQVSCTAPNSGCQDVESTSAGNAVELTDNCRGVEEFVKADATNINLVVKFGNDMPFSSSYPIDPAMPSLDDRISAVDNKQLPVLEVTMGKLAASLMRPKSNYEDVKFFENGKASRSMDDYTEAVGVSDANHYNVAADESYVLLDGGLESPHTVTSVVEDKQPFILDTADASLYFSPEIQSCKAIDPIGQQIESAAIKGYYDNKQEQLPPVRLFSGRKRISPDSKEICRDIISADMQDDGQILSCKEKLIFEKNCGDTFPSRSSTKKTRIIFTSKRLETSNTTNMSASGSETIKKGKDDRKPSVSKGIVNVPRGSLSSVQAARVCSSSKSCPQNAIIFSQQQMSDIERFATKLLSELHAMKEILVETLQSESRTCATSRYNTEKAIETVDNVKKVEKTSKRLLSMMAKDCNRFRRIMESSETNNAYDLQNCNDEYILESEMPRQSSLVEKEG
ncbi:uncharacterized protein LOC130810995 [Amaranthus tricolor]|uniref:uncharacterized protein LOC130810995 n=1 Tax=Amaranthus tricolor TaxID=29722 RepID=UPI00258C3EF0|nr:uncharacterized protein LOC130810995 [Amaranthus tricolor]XP_057533101.1 uncharacterized protein LOC130810995 [Amaranthus tricolor]XP_057533102.1 uncharacterized protein LOC130810995 [Amaranthus tricolor]